MSFFSVCNFDTSAIHGGNGLDADGVKLYCGQMGKNVADRAIQAPMISDGDRCSQRVELPEESS